MMNCKFAFVFLVVLAVVLKSSQGKSIHEIKDDIEDVKKPLIAAKIGIAKIVAAKIKLAALKKIAAAKAIIKAPFVLGKKAALLKIGAVKSLAAYKAAKVKKVLDFGADKKGPAVAAVAGISAAAAAIPTAAIAALKPKPETHSELTHHTEVVDIYTVPTAHVIPTNTQYSSYKSDLEGPRTYINDYSVVPGSATDIGSQYFPVSDDIQPHTAYGVPLN